MPSSSGRLRALLITGLPVFLVSLNLLVMAIAFPALQASFPRSSRAELSWTLNGHNIVFGTLLIPAGRAADRWGRRRVFVLGLAIFAAASVVCWLAPGVSWLVAGRVLQGAGSALVMPASLGLLLAAFPASQRATAVTIWGAIASLGAALGPTLGASIVEAAAWRWVFALYVPVAIGAAIVGRFMLSESGERAGARLPDLGGLSLFAVALSALALAIVEGRDWGWSDPRIIGAFALAIALLPLFVWRSAMHPEPVVDLSLFSIRTFSVANLAALVFSVAFFGQVLSGILYLTSVWHYGILAAALAITPTPATAALMATPAGQLAVRYGFRTVAVPGALSYSAGVLWVALFATPHPAYLTVWLPAALLLGVGIGVSFPILSAASVSQVPQARFAVAGAVNQTARQIGAVIGVALAVAILGASGFHAWFLFSAATAAVSATVSLLMGSGTASEPTGALAGTSPAGAAGAPPQGPELDHPPGVRS